VENDIFELEAGGSYSMMAGGSTDPLANNILARILLYL
jgi:hypothetical protein